MRTDMNALEKIKEWSDSDSSYLGTKTDYGKGYKDGIIAAKSIVTDFLEDKPAETQYYIDYIYNNPSGENFYYQLVRKSDDAILYANPNLDFVKLRCWELGISKDDIVIL